MLTADGSPCTNTEAHDEHCCCKALLPILDTIQQELRNLRKINDENKEENEVLRAKLMSLCEQFNENVSNANNTTAAAVNVIDSSNVSSQSESESESECESETDDDDETALKQIATYSQPVTEPATDDKISETNVETGTRKAKKTINKKKKNPKRKNGNTTKDENQEKERGKKKVVLICDSMPSRLNRSAIADATNTDFNIKHGQSRISNAIHSVRKEGNNGADALVVHVGTNNLAYDTASHMIREIRELEETIKDQISVSKVALSGIVQRRDQTYRKKIGHVNTAIQLVCERNGWNYINNSNIKNNLLWTDGLHLNKEGQARLSRNIIHEIQNFQLTRKQNEL